MAEFNGFKKSFKEIVENQSDITTQYIFAKSSDIKYKIPAISISNIVTFMGQNEISVGDKILFTTESELKKYSEIMKNYIPF